MYLIAADQQTTFTFDLATRQWLSAATPVLSSPSVEPPEIADPTIEAWPTLMTAAQIEATEQVAGTALAQHTEMILTSVALSPPVPYTPYAFRTESPEPPTSTWTTGYWECGPPEQRKEPELLSCWKSTLDNRLLWLAAGHERYPNGEPEQGILQVGFYDNNLEDLVDYDTYRTPQKVGPIRITALDGTRVSLITADPQRPPVAFTFDIATRQWLPAATTPGPSPVPSLLPTP